MNEPVQAGQVWSLWVHDDSMKETITVAKVEGSVIYGRTNDGNPCVVGISRLRDAGQLIGSIDYYAFGETGHGSLTIKVFNGKKIWALGQDLTTEEALRFWATFMPSPEILRSDADAIAQFEKDRLGGNL